MNPTIHLLVIDPQNDFCDLPETWQPQTPTGHRIAPTLPVNGAHDDMLGIAGLVDALGEHIGAITVTLDNHHRMDIAHPGFWRLPSGLPPAPFTVVRPEDLREGRILTARPEDRARALEYLEALETAARQVHVVWPVHCQMGTWGQVVHQELQRALDAWEDTWLRPVVQITKGENPWTEHYSAVRAEVPDQTDPQTGVNTVLLQRLETADFVWVTGEAGSHCVKATVEHVLEYGKVRPEQLVVVRDAMSPVLGFEDAFEAFLRDMATRGVRLATRAELIDENRPALEQP